MERSCRNVEARECVNFTVSSVDIQSQCVRSLTCDVQMSALRAALACLSSGSATRHTFLCISDGCSSLTQLILNR